MNINLSLTDEVGNAVRRRAAAAGQDVETFLMGVVTESLHEADSSPPKSLRSHTEFLGQLQAIIALHPVSDGRMDDSRDSIYAGCGE